MEKSVFKSTLNLIFVVTNFKSHTASKSQRLNQVKKTDFSSHVHNTFFVSPPKGHIQIIIIIYTVNYFFQWQNAYLCLSFCNFAFLLFCFVVFCMSDHIFVLSDQMTKLVTLSQHYKQDTCSFKRYIFAALHCAK